jgi:hypothetical protein
VSHSLIVRALYCGTETRKPTFDMTFLSGLVIRTGFAICYIITLPLFGFDGVKCTPREP